MIFAGRGAALLVALACAASVSAQGRLVLRHSEPPPGGAILEVSTQGVLVGSNASSVLVPWADVLEVEGVPNKIDARFAEIADLAWRAPLRLARGDTVTAEPMFERLLVLLDDADGPTTEAALRGLTRCQLARGARDLAIITWSRWVDALSHEDSPPVYSAGRSIPGESAPGTDQWLRAELAPFWPASNEPSLLATIEPPSDDSRVGLLLGWFRSSARLAAGLSPQFPEASSTDSAVLLVRDLALAQSGQADLARSARGRLLAQLESNTPSDWSNAWIHAAVGRSLTAERDESQRELGVVHLLHLPAQWSAVTPSLAKLALADAAATLESMGDQDGRDALLAELRRHQLASHSPQEPLP
ncbi:MAG: hypothetical protein KDB18_01120 [Salinibacterium sp.]|nr:hypothetical protein [Salinibacterium sp.]